MKVHLAWIRKTAAAALVVGVGVQTAAAQYAPFRPIPQQPAAPKQAPVAAAPTTPYVAYRTQPAYQPVPPAYQPAPVYQTQPTARYQAPVTPVPPAAPAVAYRQPVAAYPQYPQTAIAQYPTAYGTQPYYVANQPTEAIPAPAQPATSAPVMESMPGQAMPAEGMAPMAQGAPAPRLRVATAARLAATRLVSITALVEVAARPVTQIAVATLMTAAPRTSGSAACTSCTWIATTTRKCG
jgi:hypothetical protein